MLRVKAPFLLITISLLCINYNCLAQKDYKYAGFVKIQDTLLIKYKVEFTENNGKIEGFSLTDFGGKHETKSKIVGTYEAVKRVLTFSEMALLYTKSPVSMDDFDFCNVNFGPSKFKLGSDKLMGNFKGKFSDGTNCLDGEVAMNSVEKIITRVSKFTKKVQKSKRIDDSTKQKAINIKVIDTLNLNVLKHKEVTTIPTNSKFIKLYVYDAGQIDDDIVSIVVNDKKVLPRYKINAKQKELVIMINSPKTRVNIVSESVGSIGSNTAMIIVQDGDSKIKTMTNLKKGENTIIDLIKTN